MEDAGAAAVEGVRHEEEVEEDDDGETEEKEEEGHHDYHDDAFQEEEEEFPLASAGELRRRVTTEAVAFCDKNWHVGISVVN